MNCTDTNCEWCNGDYDGMIANSSESIDDQLNDWYDYECNSWDCGHELRVLENDNTSHCLDFECENYVHNCVAANSER